jgi:hypothetical protein
MRQMGWFARHRRRRQDLASGVDADLVLANGKRFRLGLGLFCFGVLVLMGTGTVHLARAALVITLSAGFASWILGVVVLHWASQERA